MFGQIKFNRAIKRFHRRGRTACRSEWRLIATAHNLLKLHTHRLAAGGAPTFIAAPHRSDRQPDLPGSLRPIAIARPAAGRP